MFPLTFVSISTGVGSLPRGVTELIISAVSETLSYPHYIAAVYFWYLLLDVDY